MAEETRFKSLDGLRGLGALVVVIYHCVLVIPAMSLSTDGTLPQAAGSSPRFSVIWWLYRTPLRVLWAGPEAVMVFFVLSGFVLCLPLLSARSVSARSVSARSLSARSLSARSWSWPAYYGRRLSRLYLPVWGALVFAVALALIVKRSNDTGSVWIRGHAPVSLSALIHDVTLVGGTSTLDSPLWSLRWEIWFSVLLPFGYLLLRRLSKGPWWPGVIAALAATSAAATTNSAIQALLPGPLAVGLLQYMPVFGIGMVMAINVDGVRVLGGRLTRGPRPSIRAGTMIALSLILLLCPSYFPGTGVGRFLGAFLSLIGVFGIITLSLSAAGLVRFLTSGPLRWAGSRSFSIYLIHEPVVVAVALVSKSAAPWPWIALAIPGMAMALLVAEFFYRLIEHPAHLLSVRFGRTITARTMQRRNRLATTTSG